MNIYIKKSVAKAIGYAKFKKFDLNEEAWGWKQSAEIALYSLTKEKVTQLKKLLEDNKDVLGVKVLLSDIEVFFSAELDCENKKARTCEQFASFLTKYLMGVDGHRIYERHGEEQWLAYYVNEVKYYPKQVHQESTTPAHVVLEGIYEEFGGKREEHWTFWADDCVGITVKTALAKFSLQSETKELRETYLRQLKQFGFLTERIGHQVYARGTGTDDLDGNNKDHNNRWWSNRTNVIQMERPAPTRCVVDVFYEDPATDRNERNRVHVDHWFWQNKKRSMRFDDDAEEEFGEDTDDRAEPEIPIHPMVAVFDMSKHLRLRVHVDYLEDYIYEPKLSEKLIIPDDHKNLIHMLVEHKDADFTDLVKGKSGGAVVLLCGKPGVGKTLTAEVYAETEQRALYSVQCSQLGVDPESIEDELLKVFARARRWNAITLLDEADVYVQQRGESLEHNAIVGVFLRVLEYQSSVLFLTTNRANDIDDAIASRCIARIVYDIPSKGDQGLIWKVLARQNKANLTDDAIRKIVEECGMHSGRDIKNLLKLAMLLKPGQPINSETINYVKRFKPTTEEVA